MKILITGASGVIGLNLSKFLQDKNNEIHVNYRNDLDNKHVKFFSECSLVHHRGDLINLLKNKNFGKDYDIIYHCAGYGQPKKFTEDKENTFLLNTYAVQMLVDILKINGKFIFMSTSELYANSSTNTEDSEIVINPNNDRNCYILGKLFGEYYLSTISKSKHIDYKNIRICLCYGPGFKNNDNRVLYEFIFQAINKNHINLMDCGDAIRKYIYIDDAINMIINIADKGKYSTYNVGGENQISIYDLAKNISEITNSSFSIGDPLKKLINSPSFSGVNIERYKKEFGKINFTNLNQGIKKCIEWYKN